MRTSKIKQFVKALIPENINTLREKEFYKETHINRALRYCNGTTYIEIGVKNGDCFKKICAKKKIGVDPSPLPERFSLEEGESFYKTTSDDFFSNHAKDVLAKKPIDVAFVDGYHEFHQVFRDISNLERYMSTNGFILIHDCNPTSKELVEDINGVWTGDVWKIAYYLQNFRKDLRFFTLNCDWGLGVLSGFSSHSEKKLHLSDQVKTFKNLSYEYLDSNRFSILNLRPYWYSWIFFNPFLEGRFR